MLTGLALCAALPALAAEFPPEISAFAYPFGHSSRDLPFDVEPLPMSPPQPTMSDPGSQGAGVATARRPPPPRSQLCAAVAFEAANNDLPIRFFSNLIEQESNFRHDVVSHKGAQGIAQ